MKDYFGLNESYKEYCNRKPASGCIEFLEDNGQLRIVLDLVSGKYVVTYPRDFQTANRQGCLLLKSHNPTSFPGVLSCSWILYRWKAVLFNHPQSTLAFAVPSKPDDCSGLVLTLYEVQVDVLIVTKPH